MPSTDLRELVGLSLNLGYELCSYSEQLSIFAV